LGRPREQGTKEMKTKSIKVTLIFFFSVLSIVVKSQQSGVLKKVYNGHTMRPNEAIVYGTFIPRLGMVHSLNFHEVRFQNVNTGEVLTLRIKPKSRKSQDEKFVLIIPPGTYTILNYMWPEKRWYGNMIYTEPVFKGINSLDNLEKKVLDGQIPIENLQQFSFTVSPKTVSYVGTWNFSSSLVSFTDDKENMDNSIKTKYKKLDLTKALTVIPD
jgi:hypothetical protein